MNIRRVLLLFILSSAFLGGGLRHDVVRVSASVQQEPLTVSPDTVSGMKCGGGTENSPPCRAPYPMLSKGHPVDWWFVFKLNAKKFPTCGNGDTRTCPFGGKKQTYKAAIGMQYAFASKDSPTLQMGGKECMGTTTDDPVGATFDEVYNSKFHYVVWNDQFYGDPKSASCGGNGCSSGTGHSKGILAWNDDGEGLVMQVSTPSWPRAGNSKSPQIKGNTLGCIKDDNDVSVSQHFFALRLKPADLELVLQALTNAHVVTEHIDTQLVEAGKVKEIEDLVNGIGAKNSPSAGVKVFQLSSGVQLISKSPTLAVPPWQMVSSLLGGISLRTATWWESRPSAAPIYTTTAATPIRCWNKSLTTKPGAVEIAMNGVWQDKPIRLEGGLNPDGNHAKLGVSTSGDKHYAIFGDMNQEGSISGTNCSRSQNGRGGMFFVMENTELWQTVTDLIAGKTEPTKAPPNVVFSTTKPATKK